MRTLLVSLCGLALVAVSCYSISTPTPIPGLVSTIVVQTAQAAYTQTAIAAPPTPTAATVVSCVDSAALAQDASAEAGMSVPAGSKFSLTWQLSNTGECSWHGYSIAFVSGNRFNAPDTIPVQDTAPKSTATILVELLAPATGGSFTGAFELRDATGKAVSLGAGTSFSVTVAVADLGTATPIPVCDQSAPPDLAYVLPVPPSDCKYSTSFTYANEIVSFINKARADAGLPALTVNNKLVTSAQAHSTDMACNSYRDHCGSDKSTIVDRIVAAGYSPKHPREMIYCWGQARDAFDWWMQDKGHHDLIVDPQLTELGVGYAFVKNSACQSSFTVDMAAP